MLCLRWQGEIAVVSAVQEVLRAEGWSGDADGLMASGAAIRLGFPPACSCWLVGSGMSFPDSVTELSTTAQDGEKKKCGRKSSVEISQWQGSESLSGRTSLTDRIPSAAIVIQESVPSRLLVPASFVPHLSREFCGCLTDFPAACEKQSRLAVNPHRL